MEVALGDVVLVGLEPVVVARQEYALALTTVFWFNNKCLGPAFVKLLLELFYVPGEYPRIRKEVVVLREVLLHADQVPRQQILAGHSVHAREVVCALVVLHLGQEGREDGSIDKPDVPLFVFRVGARAQIAIGSDLVDNLILSVADVQLELRVVEMSCRRCVRAESAEGLISFVRGLRNAFHFNFLWSPVALVHYSDATGVSALGLVLRIAGLRVGLASCGGLRLRTLGLSRDAQLVSGSLRNKELCVRDTGR